MAFHRKQKDTISREEFRKKLDDMGVEYRERCGEIIPMRFWWNKSITLSVTMYNTKKDTYIHRSETLKEIESIYNRVMDTSSGRIK